MKLGKVATENMTRPDDAQELACNIFSDLYQTIISYEEGVRAGDVEAVHDMRVAGRRMRVALSNFAVCCRPEVRRTIRARLGRLADALGAVRDLDVMIAALKKRNSALNAEQGQYIRGLIRRLQARRLRRRRQLLNYLRGDDYAGFRQDFSILMQRGSRHLSEAETTSREETIAHGKGTENQETLAG